MSNFAATGAMELLFLDLTSSKSSYLLLEASFYLRVTLAVCGFSYTVFIFLANDKSVTDDI